MKVEKCKKQRLIMESEIYSLVNEFESTTGLQVEGLDLHRVDLTTWDDEHRVMQLSRIDAVISLP